MRVLLLMSDTGGGHRSVSRALVDGFSIVAKETGCPIDARVFDLFAPEAPGPIDRMTRLYGPTIRTAPAAYGLLFHATNRRQVYRQLNRWLGVGVRRRAARVLASHRPDLVVFVHSLCISVTLDALAVLRLRVPTAAMVTELVTVHASWFDPRVELSAVATPETDAAMRQWGAVPERLRLTGLPVGHRFGRVDRDPKEIRASLGLEPDRTTVLVIGGGEGSGGLDEVAQTVAEASPENQIVIVCGRNETLRRRLENQTLACPGRVLGFVDTMADLMHAADFIVTKGGPQSVSEALTSRRPVIITQILPGQEQGNGEYVVRHGAGLLGDSPGALAACVSMMSRDTALRRRLAAGAARLGRPDAAENAARAFARLAIGQTTQV
ncbi:MAG TPA: glycosyltransferase [Chloroflexota bacterium]|nr:glycosyltransferase [Chloroflexota bacterium]